MGEKIYFLKKFIFKKKKYLTKIMDKNQFRNYLTIIFPKSNLRENEEGFDFVLSITPTLSKKRELLSSGGGVLRRKSTNSIQSNIKILVISNKKRDANNTSNVRNILHRPINGPSSGNERISNSYSSFFQPERSTSSSTVQGGSISSSSRNREYPMKFSTFLDEQESILDSIKTDLKKILSDPNWTVYNPRGDGFCTIYAIYKDLGVNIETKNKNFFIDKLYEAMKTYIDTTVHKEILIRPYVKYHTIGKYSFRDENAQETKKKLLNYVQNNTLPDDIKQFYYQNQNENDTQINIEKLYNILKTSFQGRTGPFKQKDVIDIEDFENILITKKDFQGQNIQITKNFLETLKNSDDLGTELVQCFPYITGRNILYITVDKSSKIPIGIKYYEGKRDSSKTQNTILFNWSGHTVLLQNSKKIKNNLVKPYFKKFSPEQITILHGLGIREDRQIANMTRERFNEIMNS